MFALLNWRVLLLAALVCALSFTHFSAYRAGKANVRAEWSASVAAANIEARQIEQHRETVLGKARDAATARQTRNSVGVARVASADDGLRAALDAAELVAKESTATAAKYAAALRANFDDCRAKYKDLGAAAAGHASDSLMYQEAWPK